MEIFELSGNIAPRELVRGSECMVFRRDLADFGLDPVFLVNSEKHDTGSAGLCHPNVPRPGEPVPRGRWFGLVGDTEKKRFLLVGFLLPVHNRTFVRVHDGILEAGWILHRDFAKDETLIVDRPVILEGSDPHALLEEFGDRCAHETPPFPTPEPPKMGWNSWDYYFGAFSLHELQEQLEVIRNFNTTSSRPVETVFIDMCWHTRYGEWSGNGLWPGGMKHAAHLIRQEGLTPGIWLAPLEVAFDTFAFLRTPEILVTGLKGEILIDEWAGGGFGWVDPTSKAGENFLRSLFQSLKNDGFEAFKLDFLHYPVTHAAALERHFAKDGQMGRIDVIRRALELVRESIGTDSYLLSCGCMPEASAGIADANRIGIDVSTYDSTVRLAVPFLASRYWMNRRCFLNDPDFLMVRSDQTSQDSHHNPCHPANLPDAFGSRTGSTWQTLGEIRIWATLAGISGGVLSLGDHLGKLNSTGCAMLETVLTHARPEAARPIDLMEKLYPEIWISSTQAALFNWSDKPKILDLSAQSELLHFQSAQDLWQNAKISPKTITIPSHDAVWLEKITE